MKKFSDQLNDLSLRAKNTEDVIEAAMAKNRERLQAQLDSLTSAAQAQRTQADQHMAQAKAQAQSKWQQLRDSVDDHFATVRANAAHHKAEHDARRAEHHADHAEDDALDAVDFALYALEQADYAIIEAVIARAEADELMAQT